MKTSPLALALALSVALGSAAPAFAQQMNMPPAPAGQSTPPSGDAPKNATTPGRSTTSPASDAYMKAMADMNKATQGMNMTGDPSKDFVMMMKPHHQAAVDMAEAYLKYGKDPRLTRMAKKIVRSQTREIAAMDKWSKKHGGM